MGISNGGTNAHLETPAEASPVDGTVCFWLDLTSFPGFSRPYSMGGGFHGHLIRIDSNVLLRLFVGTGVTNLQLTHAVANLSAAGRVFVWARWDSGALTMELGLDATSSSQVMAAGASATASTFAWSVFGRSDDVDSLDGIVENLLIFNSHLSFDEIQAIRISDGAVMPRTLPEVWAPMLDVAGTTVVSEPDWAVPSRTWTKVGAGTLTYADAFAPLAARTA